MNQNNKQALQEVVSGVFFFLLIVGAFIPFIYLLFKEAAPDSNRFETVDQYGDCKVVRYNPKDSSRYVYFLDCPVR